VLAVFWRHAHPPERVPGPELELGERHGLLSITHIGGWMDLAEVVDVQVEVHGQNPYGEVKSGTLTLRAALERLWVSEEPNPDEDKFPHKRQFRMRSKEGGKMGWYVSFDIELESDRETVKMQEFYLVPLAAPKQPQPPDRGGWECFALVVMPHATKKDCYQRMGFSILQDTNEVQKWKHLKEKNNLITVVLA